MSPFLQITGVLIDKTATNADIKEEQKYRFCVLCSLEFKNGAKKS
jgi:hypothetical protein